MSSEHVIPFRASGDKAFDGGNPTAHIDDEPSQKQGSDILQQFRDAVGNGIYGPINRVEMSDDLKAALREMDRPENLFVRQPDKQFTRSDMKAFGDHCRIVMNGRYSEVAMDALLDTWVENRKVDRQQT